MNVADCGVFESHRAYEEQKYWRAQHEKLESSVTKKCKLLCPSCGLKQVKDTGDPIVLECGHSRGELLPLKPGRISVEHLSKRIGQECFPTVLPREFLGDELTIHAGIVDLPDLSEKAIESCLEALGASHEAIEY